MEKISRKIELFRKSKGLSITDFAKQLKVSRHTVYNWRDKSTVSMATIMKLAEVFPDLDLNWLLRDEIDEKEDYLIREEKDGYVSYLESTIESIKRIAQVGMPKKYGK